MSAMDECGSQRNSKCEASTGLTGDGMSYGGQYIEWAILPAQNGVRHRQETHVIHRIPYG